MIRKTIIGATGMVILCMLACGNTNNKQQNTRNNPIVKQEQKKGFQLPEVPIMLNTPEQRAVYVAEHYWDHFDFADTAYIHLPDITEQAIVNFMDLMGHVPSEVESLALRTLYQKTAPHSPMLWYFWETMSRYWHDPNSPMKNEEKFIKMCKSIESLKQVEEIFLQRVLYARTLAEKNRIGINATDFVYTLASGKQGKLYDLRAEYILIFFYNPDCHTCTDIKRAMKNSRRLKDMVKSRRIMVLTVYPDENVELWREHLSDMANEWVNAYDKGQVITHEMLYDLSSIPSFYLLDKNKKVLLKDADWRQVLHFFEK
jgi:thioredoxin-related protein